MLATALGLPARARREEELAIADSPTTVFHGRGPSVLLMNGATPQGRRHPAIRRLAAGLARAGHLVFVPDVYGVDRGEISDRTVAATLRIAGAAPGRVAFLGVSVGTTLALLAAEDPGLAGRVSVVGGIAGYTDLVDLIRIATTGTYREGERLAPFNADPFLALCVARSVCAAASTELAGVEPDEHDPLGCFPRLPGPAPALLANRDPARFDALYPALPGEVRAAVERLSPLAAAPRLRAPVEILSDPDDKYFPLEQTRALARAAPQVKLTTTHLLSHADTRIGWRDLPDLAGLAGFVTRALRRARFG